MATFTIASKSAKSPVVGTDEVLIQETGGGTVKKSILSVLADYVLKTITGLTDKPTPVTTDIFAIQETGGTVKKLTLANLWAYLLGLIRNIILVPVTVGKTVSYVILDTDGYAYIENDTTGGDITTTLPLGANNVGRKIRIANVKGGTNKVIIVPNATDANKLTNDGLNVYWLPKIGDYLTVQWSATSGFWEVIDEKVTSQLRLNTYAGHGSTDTKIVRFTNVVENIGNMFSENHTSGYSANAKGLEITINRSGRYSFDFCYHSVAGTDSHFGFSLNSSQLTTALDGITITDIVSMATAASNTTGQDSVNIYLPKGAIIRFHDNGLIPATAGFCRASVTFVR